MAMNPKKEQTRIQIAATEAFNLKNGPVRQAVFWLISRLLLFCCERKTLFHG
jgi:hypothetical protein